MKFRAGDIVSVRATVKHNFNEGDDDVALAFSEGIIGGASFWAAPHLLTVVKQGIVIGDNVVFGVTDPDGAGRPVKGTVLAICNGHAWIDLGGGDYCTRTLSSIERAEA